MSIRADCPKRSSADGLAVLRPPGIVGAGHPGALANNDLPRGLDQQRMARAAGDLIESRPLLSFWLPVRRSSSGSV